MWAELHPNTVVVVYSQSVFAVCPVRQLHTALNFGVQQQLHFSAYMDIREAAVLRQQRRIKQAIQFLHKDSADLLPLDGLNKLGTSKEWVRQALHSRLSYRIFVTTTHISAIAAVEYLKSRPFCHVTINVN